MKLRDSFHTYAVITVLLWSLSYVFTRLALRYFSSVNLGFLRFGIASVALIAGLVATKTPLPALRDLPWFFGKGITSFFLYMMAFNRGSKTVSAATISVIISTSPILTALLVRIFYKEKLKTIQYVAIGIEFLGVFILTALNGILTVNTGALWLVLASFSGAVSNLFLRKLLQRYKAFPATAYSILIGTVFMGIFSRGAIGELRNAPGNQIVILLVLGLLPSAVAYVTWSEAFKKAKTTTSVTNYLFTTPFITALLGLVAAGERLESSTIIGGIVILAGMFVFHYGEKFFHKKTGNGKIL